MNLPDQPLRHWTDSDPQSFGEPELPDLLDCECGHTVYEDEVVYGHEGEALMCTTCANARNTRREQDFQVPETDNPNEERTR